MSSMSITGRDGHVYGASLSSGAVSVVIAGNAYLLRRDGDQTVIEVDGHVVHHNKIGPEATAAAHRMRKASGR